VRCALLFRDEGVRVDLLLVMGFLVFLVARLVLDATTQYSFEQMVDK